MRVFGRRAAKACSRRGGVAPALDKRWTPPLTRNLHSTPSAQAGGVFQALVASRITTPWIEALRNRTETGSDGSQIGEKDMSPRTMSDSYHRAVLPLNQDPWLSDTYLNASGHIRLGTIFMDLDALAGIIAYKHTGENVTVVTAACDRITIENPLTELCDLEYSGQVTYATGRSSMEITCKVARAPAEGQTSKDEDVMLTCTFTMVALDPETKKPTGIAPLKLTSPREEALYNSGAARAKAKKTRSLRSLQHSPPTATEAALLHTTWLRQLAYHDPNNALRRPANAHSMSATKLRATAIMQPQFRNRHNFVVFGGFLMQQTFELAFCCAASLARARPRFLSLDPSTFLNPVPVGGVLYLTATAAYTDPPIVSDAEAAEAAGGADAHEVSQRPAQRHADAEHQHQHQQQQQQQEEPRKRQTRVQIRVDGKVRDLDDGTVKPTGQFNYTFVVDGDVRVMPESYTEGMIYLDAKRRADMMGELDEEGGKKAGSGVDERERVTE